MKKLFIIISLLFVVFQMEAQIKYPFGAAETETITLADTTTTGVIDLPEIFDNMTIYTMSCDTNLTIKASDIKVSTNAGAMLVFHFNETTANADTITWSTNMAGVSTKIPAGKRTIVTFIKIGTSFYKLSETQQN